MRRRLFYVYVVKYATDLVPRIFVADIEDLGFGYVTFVRKNRIISGKTVSYVDVHPFSNSSCFILYEMSVQRQPEKWKKNHLEMIHFIDDIYKNLNLTFYCRFAICKIFDVSRLMGSCIPFDDNN